MARINIDSKFFADSRIALLSKKLKEDILMTYGRLLLLWHDCYENKRCSLQSDAICAVSRHDEMANALIASGMAVVQEDGILYLKGVAERISYLQKKSDAARKGAESRWGKCHSHADAEQEATTCMPSSSSSSSSSSSNSKDINTLRGETAPQVSPKVKDFISAYCDAFKNRYQTNPPIMGRTAGIAKRVVKDLGLPESIKLIRAFLQIGMDPWISSKKHSLEVFEKNIEAIKVFAETGKYLTMQEAQQRERNSLKRH